MKKKWHNTFLQGLTLFTGLLATGFALGHANFIPKDNLDQYTGRDYQEGTTAYIKLVLPHSCSSEDHSQTYATRHTSIVFPNAEVLTGITYTTDGTTDYGGNAVMSILPKVDINWRDIQTLTGDVPSYYDYGLQTTDVRGIHWRRGYMPDGMYAELAFRAKLPLLAGCTERLRVYMPVVQYCTHGNIQAWLREPTPSFDASVISPGYAPFIDVVRDLEQNPLASSCSDGEIVEAYPAEEDIETYLMID